MRVPKKGVIVTVSGNGKGAESGNVNVRGNVRGNESANESANESGIKILGLTPDATRTRIETETETETHIETEEPDILTVTAIGRGNHPRLDTETIVTGKGIGIRGMERLARDLLEGDLPRRRLPRDIYCRLCRLCRGSRYRPLGMGGGREVGDVGGVQVQVQAQVQEEVVLRRESQWCLVVASESGVNSGTDGMVVHAVSYKTRRVCVGGGGREGMRDEGVGEWQ